MSNWFVFARITRLVRLCRYLSTALHEGLFFSMLYYIFTKSYHSFLTHALHSPLTHAGDIYPSPQSMKPTAVDRLLRESTLLYMIERIWGEMNTCTYE